MVAIKDFGEMISEDELSDNGPGDDIESPIQILAKTSIDIIENIDLAEIIEVEVRKLMESLGLDFAIFRLMSPDDRPLMLCHGLDFKEARENP